MVLDAKVVGRRIWRALPKGGSLPDEVWRRRHRGIVALLLAHVVGLSYFATVAGHGLAHSGPEVASVAGAAAVASYRGASRAVRSGAATVGLVSASAVLVHLSGGVIEMHFHFFVVIAIISLYQDWVPFLLALGYVVLHHGTIGVLNPESVYNHPAAANEPWKWAAIHGAFVLAASAASLTTWRLNEEGFYDHLTGLANRKLFMDRVEMGLARVARYRDPMAVLFIDLDNFKAVNDGLGHGAGDELLANVAERLGRSMRPSDTVARLGGDEFAVLVERLGNSVRPEMVADRILEVLRPPCLLDGHPVVINASIGIATSESGEQGADEILRNADLAMYIAKANGKGRRELYEPAMHVAVVERLEMEAELRSALERDELVLHYQPVMALRSGRLVGVEALVRWAHPARGMVLPDEFIPLAEETGLIVPLGLWVLVQACGDLRQWQERYPADPPLTVAVNLSAAQLRPGLAEAVAAVLEGAGLAPQSLVFEITESLVVDETSNALSHLEALKELGVALAIDDFGTGYSSLSRLQSFPVDAVKIDRSFVHQIGDGHHSLVPAIMAMAASLGLGVVAEGIETASQLEFLQLHGCDVAQGFLLGRPMDADSIEGLLAGRPWDSVLATSSAGEAPSN